MRLERFRFSRPFVPVPVAIQLWVGVVACTSSLGLHGASSEPTGGQGAVSLWDYSVSARMAVGYDDNLLQSSLFNQESPLTSLEVDASLWRPPSDGKELFVFLIGQYTQYLPDREPENNQLLYLVGHGRVGPPEPQRDG